MQIRLARALFTARIMFNNFTRGLPVRVMMLQALVTFGALLPLMCANLPHSAYYWPGDLRRAHFRLRNEDESRIARGNAYIAELKSRRWAYQPDADAQGPRLAIAILAIDRNNRKIDAYQPHYLTQTVHSLLASVDRDHRLYGGRFKSLDVAICNADPDAPKFAEARRWGQVLPVLSRSQQSVLPLPRGPAGASVGERCQPKTDWAWCLSALSSANPKAEWLAVIEDDQLARLDSLSAIHELLETKLGRRFGRDQRQARVGLVQLHSPANKLRYDWLDSSSWLELMLIGGCIGGACFMLYYRMFCNPILFLPNMALMSYLFVYSMALVLAVGRPNWLAARHALTRIYTLDAPLTDAFSAVLLPRESLERLTAAGMPNASSSNASSQCWNAEHIVNLLLESGRRILAVYPSLLRHIGLYSAHYNGGGLLPTHLLD